MYIAIKCKGDRCHLGTMGQLIYILHLMLTMSAHLQHGSCGFYLPGDSPITYSSNCTASAHDNTCQKNVMVYINRLNSVKNILPYEYHDFDFCLPEPDVANSSTENFGQALLGDRIRPSLYNMNFGESIYCAIVCEKHYSNSDREQMEKLNFLKKGISFNYQHHWILDNMPITWCYKVESGENYCSTGFPIGCYVTKNGQRKDSCITSALLADSEDYSDFSCISPPRFDHPDTYYVYNHVDILIEYQPVLDTQHMESGGRIVSVELTPISIDHSEGIACSIFRPALGIPGVHSDEDMKIIYTYSVRWKENTEILWATRWNNILDSVNITWFSLFNSLATAVFLSGMGALIFYGACSYEMNKKEEFRWQLLHDDVFRPPKNGMFLAVFVGNGTQLLFTTLFTLVFGCLGFLSPSSQGALVKCTLILYAFCGIPAGYVSARLYKTFGGEKRKLNVILTAFLCPGLVFGVFYLLNLVFWAKGSSAAILFSTLKSLLVLWFGLSVPLTFVGAYLGFRKNTIEHPTHTSKIRREIPKQSWHTCPLTGIIMGGVLPFLCITTQLFFFLNSIWFHQICYMFGFSFLVFILLITICSEATIYLCYLHLCAEDYHWWWRSFLTSGFTAIYVFFYCIHFFFTKLEMSGFTNTFLYFGYTGIIVLLFFITSGSIGFLSCYCFVRKIYSSVKVDQDQSFKPVFPF